MSWVSEAEALALTGVAVTDEQITQAQGVIDLFSGVVEGVEELTVRDTRLLRMATAYQAVWMLSQVDVLSRTIVHRIEQDGAVIWVDEPNDFILAPLAKRALAQMSWNRRTGTTVVCPGGPRTYRNIEEYGAAWLRDETGDSWRPM